MERFDNNKKFIFCSIIRKNRLDSYKKYLQYAQRQGYCVCGLEEFYKNRNSDKKYFVLRHDVDWCVPATQKMYEVEKELGVRSTSYFRYNTIDKALIEDMINNGFEVGFHYETIANYVSERAVASLQKEDFEHLKVLLKEEIREFEKKIGNKISSIASHGHEINRKIGVSNNAILEGESYSDFGVLFEAYDEEMYEKNVDCHIMDTHILFNYGFAYESNPIDAINNGYKHIIFLSHANHWYGTTTRVFKDIIYFFFGKGKDYIPRKFKRILHVEGILK